LPEVGGATPSTNTWGVSGYVIKDRVWSSCVISSHCTLASTSADVSWTQSPWSLRTCRQRDVFIDNLLVRIHFILVMIRWTGLAPWEFEFPFPGSPTSTFLVPGGTTCFKNISSITRIQLIHSPYDRRYRRDIRGVPTDKVTESWSEMSGRLLLVNPVVLAPLPRQTARDIHF